MIIRKMFFGFFGVALYLCGNYALQWSSAFAADYLTTSTLTTETVEDCLPASDKNTIQVALLLDTSSSMSGLIEQAKSQLWNILNQLARTTHNDQETSLEIALYEYGNPNKATSKYQINQLTPFTTDMDLVSEKLFSLRTSGGEEYCGAIIKHSFDELKWIKGDGLKIIYIAGNEEFDQGPISFKTSCQKAVESGITINTIYCGGKEAGINELWKAGAIAGRGDYMFIEQNRATVYVPTPYDKEIQRLNSELNKTYIPFGKEGQKKKENQEMQDTNAGSYSLSNVSDRAAYKSSKKYSATSWDLIDAYADDNTIINTAEVTVDSLQGLSIEELEVKIKIVSSQRAAIQKDIQELDKKRREYKAENAAPTEETSLQKSIISNVNKLAKDKGYRVKE
ncbi:MAG: hypothetical protein AB8F74_08800 [Saprospiraceae bacterium]